MRLTSVLGILSLLASALASPVASPNRKHLARRSRSRYGREDEFRAQWEEPASYQEYLKCLQAFPRILKGGEASFKTFPRALPWAGAELEQPIDEGSPGTPAAKQKPNLDRLYGLHEEGCYFENKFRSRDPRLVTLDAAVTAGLFADPRPPIPTNGDEENSGTSAYKSQPAPWKPLLSAGAAKLRHVASAIRPPSLPSQETWQRWYAQALASGSNLGPFPLPSGRGSGRGVPVMRPIHP